MSEGKGGGKVNKVKSEAHRSVLCVSVHRSNGLRREKVKLELRYCVAWRGLA